MLDDKVLSARVWVETDYRGEKQISRLNYDIGTSAGCIATYKPYDEVALKRVASTIAGQAYHGTYCCDGIEFTSVNTGYDFTKHTSVRPIDAKETDILMGLIKKEFDEYKARVDEINRRDRNKASANMKSSFL